MNKQKKMPRFVEAKVLPMLSHSGRTVPNQYMIRVANGMYFQSYGTLIAFQPSTGETTYLSKNWNYSATTMKYLRQFLGGDGKQEILKGLETGEYKIVTFF